MATLPLAIQKPQSFIETIVGVPPPLKKLRLQATATPPAAIKAKPKVEKKLQILTLLDVYMTPGNSNNSSKGGKSNNSGTIIGSSGNIIGSSGKIIGSSGNIIGNSGNMIGSCSNIISSSGNIIGSSSNIIGSSSNIIGNSGNIIGSSGNIIVSSSNIIANSSNIISSNIISSSSNNNSSSNSSSGSNSSVSILPAAAVASVPTTTIAAAPASTASNVASGVVAGSSSSVVSVISGGVVSTAIVSGSAASSVVASAGVASVGVASGVVVSVGAASGGVASGSVASGGVVSGGVASGGVASGSVASGGVASGIMPSVAAASGGVVSGSTASSGVAGSSVASGSVASVGAASGGVVSGGGLASGGGSSGGVASVTIASSSSSVASGGASNGANINGGIPNGSCQTRELLDVLVKITDEISYENVQIAELKESAAKLFQLYQLQEKESDTSVRVKLLELLSGLGCECSTEEGIILIIDYFIYLLRKETSQKVLAQGMMCLYRIGQKRPQMLPLAYKTQVAHLAKEQLRSGSTHTQKNAMLVIGRFASCHEGERQYVWKLGFYIDSQDSGVRAQALHALLTLGERGSHLPPVLYKRAVEAMKDDYECVRKEALQLVHMIGNRHPDYIINMERQPEDLRMIDAAFSKVCEALCDLSLQIRVLAAELLGSMTQVSSEFLHQTLDKKLMSNLRRKRNAHERGASLVTSGEWSSGKRWADDAPQERLDARTISLIASGACGALIHGLEDEFLEVRTAAVGSMCKLAMSRPDFAVTSLDFLVDMFNDEIEDVRLKAIYSLTLIARHIVLREDQLEIMLGSLEDYSVDVREGLHLMLGACRVSTQTCLIMVVQKLLDVLAKYPQDRHSTYACMRKIGQKHPHLVMALTGHLLYVHPFFETPERDVEDPAYLCVLILVFNAAEHLVPIISLLPTATHRHYAYLRDSMPKLVPQLPIEGASSSSTTKRIDDALKAAGSSAEYLKMIIDHIGEIFTMTNERVELLKLAQSSLQRLGAIDSDMYGTSNFLETFISAQIQIEHMQRCARTRRIRVPLKETLAELIRNCLKLQHTFSGLNYGDVLQVKQLRLRASALHLVLAVRDKSQSALGPCQMLLQTAGDISAYMRTRKKSSAFAEQTQIKDEDLKLKQKATGGGAGAGEVDEPDSFTRTLLSKLDAITDPKPGRIFREILPLVQNAKPLALPPANEKIRRCMANILEPCPLQSQDNVIKVTAGLIAAVPFVAEIDNLLESQKADMRIKIKYPDQHMHTVVPKMTDFKPIMTEQGEHESNVRLRTTILLSHSVWTESSLVEIQLCLAVKPGSELEICKPAKVLFAPKPVRRGI